MRKVVCINDKKQPEGGELVEGKEYEIEEEFINNHEQKTFIIAGINNYGMTKMGMRWYGYNANRFADLDALVIESYEHVYAFN
jgi:hypothetical protein